MHCLGAYAAICLASWLIRMKDWNQEVSSKTAFYSCPLNCRSNLKIFSRPRADVWKQGWCQAWPLWVGIRSWGSCSRARSWWDFGTATSSEVLVLWTWKMWACSRCSINLRNSQSAQSMGQAVMLTAPYKPSGVFFSSEEMGSKNELPGCRWKCLVQPQALLG